MIRFPIDERMMRLYEHTKAAKDRRPSAEQLFDDSLHKGGVVKLNENGWPDKDNIDTSRIEPGFHLVKDSGIYLMSNAAEPIYRDEQKKLPLVHYARDCDPNKDEDCWETCRALFGGDDGVVDIPLAWFEMTLQEAPTSKDFVIEINDDRVSLVFVTPHGPDCMPSPR